MQQSDSSSSPASGPSSPTPTPEHGAVVAVRIVVAAAGGMALVLFAHAPWWLEAGILGCIAVPAESGTIVRRLLGGGSK